jgi:DNA-binding transcriptional LysR family regulator
VRGQVVVASIVSLADAALPALMAGYTSRFPGIEIHLREGLQSAVKDDVRAGVADFGIGYVDDLPDAFATEALGVETFRLVLRRDHPLAGKPRIKMQALAEVPLVSFPPESHTRRITDAAAAAEGVALRYVLTANRLPTLLGLVGNGVGPAIVPASERPSAKDRVLTSLPLSGPRLSCHFGLMRLRDREPSVATLAFIDMLRTWWRAA